MSLSKKYTKIKTDTVPHFIEDNLIQKIFGGALASSVVCGKCKTYSKKIDRFIDISLEISGTDNLISCLAHFCKPEELKGSNQYYCEKCKKRNDSIKKLSFENFPRILVIHLKRFDNYQRKIKTFIKYDTEIDLTSFKIDKKKEKFKYRLCAVLIHDGNSIDSGHYYCYVKVSDNSWYCFNDHSVQKVEESTVLKKNLLIYYFMKDLLTEID